VANLSAIKSDDHARLLRERDRFLGDHPELKELQRDIDDKLRKASSNHNRLVIIHGLMLAALSELDNRLQVLVGRRR